MLSTWLLLASLTAAPAPTALPPTPRFRHYGVAQGLPSSRVYAVVQDRTGYMWVGTGDGLARFDGQHFELFRHDPADPASLPTNDVSALLIDQQGRLWVGGEGTGLNRFDPDTGGFDHWMHNDAVAASLSGNDVFGLAQTPDGSIWVSVYAGGVNRLLANGQGFVHLRHVPGDDNSLASDNVVAVHADSAGRLWIGSDHGLDVRLPDGTIRHVRFDGLDKPPMAWQISGDGNDIRVATNVGLFVVGADGVARRPPTFGDSTDSVFSSLRGPAGNLWIGARGALNLVTSDGQERSFQTRPLLQGGLPAQLIVNMFVDNEGGLWLATLDAGLVYLSPYWREFSRFGHIPEEPGSLVSSRVLALAVDNHDRLLVGGPNGQLDRLDPTTGVVEHLAARIGVAPKSVRGVWVDSRNRIWIAPERGGLRVFDHGQRRRIGADKFRNSVYQVVFDDEDDLYASPVGEGMFHIDADSLSLTGIGLAGTRAADAETSGIAWHNGVLWRASAAGLSRLDQSADAFRFVAGVSIGDVNAFAFDGSILWLARPDALEQYRVTSGRATLQSRIAARADWPAIEINGMIVDVAGRLWLTSRVGLWRFDPHDGTFRRYGIADGLPSPQFTGALVTLKNGTAYAGTLNGVVGFRPGSLRDHVQPPQLVLAGASVRRGGHWSALPLDGAPLHLGWGDGELRIRAQALSYIDPNRNHYRFRMRGLDSDWVNAGGRGERVFPDLDAGNYSLRIQAAGPSGVWQALAQPLRIEVAAPPWRTSWAWALYGIAAIALIWFVIATVRRRAEQRFHLHAVEDRRRLAEDASAAKTRFLATLGHEIRTPMTGVLGMVELLGHTELSARQRGLAETIQHSGEVLLKLVNDALDLARIEAGRFELELAPFDPGGLLREVGTMHASLAAGKGLATQVDVAREVPRQVIGDAVRIRQILMNLTTNAMKFTDGGTIRLSLELCDKRLRYSVADSGPGLAARDRKRLFKRFEQGADASPSGGSGLGLAICRELTVLMDGHIEVDSKPGKGSVFRVSLPCVRAKESRRSRGVIAPRAALRLRIVLVEDDPVVAEVLVGLLEAEGHQVRHITHTLAAMAELEVAPCDVLLVDIDLPDIDGFELIGMVRARPEPAMARIAIVVVTARAESGDEARARQAGADAFLRKPVSGERLAAVLAEVTERTTADRAG